MTASPKRESNSVDHSKCASILVPLARFPGHPWAILDARPMAVFLTVARSGSSIAAQHHVIFPAQLLD